MKVHFSRLLSPRLYWIAGAALMCLAALVSPVTAQERPSSSEQWEVPRTVFGHPDLQGNWTNATLTPFERPAGWERALTWEEVAEIEQGQAELVARKAEASDPDRPPPPEGGTHPVCIDGPTSCYNEFYREPGDRVAVVNGEFRSSLGTNPSNGCVPSLTPEGRRRVDDSRALSRQFGAYDHPEVRPLAERCIVSFGSSAGPPMLPNYWYNNNYTIVQNADYVMIMAEMVHDVRIIRLGEPRSLPTNVRPYFGDSRGWWEGNTLVVETKNLNPEHAFRGVPPSEDLRVIERFTRVADDRIHFEFTVEDPATWDQPWSAEIPMMSTEGPMYEYACHEGNHDIRHILEVYRNIEAQEAASQQ